MLLYTIRPKSARKECRRGRARAAKSASICNEDPRGKVHRSRSSTRRDRRRSGSLCIYEAESGNAHGIGPL